MQARLAIATICLTITIPLLEPAGRIEITRGPAQPLNVTGRPGGDIQVPLKRLGLRILEKLQAAAVPGALYWYLWHTRIYKLIPNSRKVEADIAIHVRHTPRYASPTSTSNRGGIPKASPCCLLNNYLHTTATGLLQFGNCDWVGWRGNM